MRWDIGQYVVSAALFEGVEKMGGEVVEGLSHEGGAGDTGAIGGGNDGADDPAGVAFAGFGADADGGQAVAGEGGDDATFKGQSGGGKGIVDFLEE